MEKCLICEAETLLYTTNNFDDYHCKNGCMQLVKDKKSTWQTYIVFNKLFALDFDFLGEEEYNQRLRILQDEVNYWKKDYRYLAKILTES